MENVSQSLPKRSFSSISNAAYTSHRSVYDDVFGGAPKFGLPTLAPRLEDYSEIFGGFHASRSSSIPVLDLPLIGDDSGLHFDVQSPALDYTEVFGNFGSLDFTASFEDLVGQSSGGYESSDEPWSPEQSGSLSDEFGPLAGSDKSHRLSDGDLHQTLDSINQFNISYNSSQRNIETVLTGTSLVTDLSAVPGYTFSHYDSPVSWNGEDEHCSVHVNDDIDKSKEFDRGATEEQQYKKHSSNLLNSDFNAHESDCNLVEKHGNSTLQDKPFVTVSDISLRTKPSRLPPPSRPPPALDVKKGEFDKSNSKPKASKSYAFEGVADDSAPILFDVEIDAALCVEDRKNGNENVKHDSTKESMEREDIQSHDARQAEEKTSKILRVNSGLEEEKSSSSRYLQYGNHITDNSTGAVAWREANEYFEVIEQNRSKHAFCMVDDFNTSTEHMNEDAYRHQRTTDPHTFNQKEDSKKFKVTMGAHRWDEKWNQPEMTGDHCDHDNKQQKEMLDARFSDEQGFDKKVIWHKVARVYSLDKMIPENIQQLRESEKVQNYNSETIKGLAEANGKMFEMEDELKLNASPKRKDILKRFIDPQLTKQNSEKFNQNILRKECRRRLEDLVGAETVESVMERTEAEAIDKKHTEPSGREKENKLRETHKLNENWMILELTKNHGDSGKKQYIAAGQEKGGNEQLACEVEKDKERLIEFGKQEVIYLRDGEALEQVGNGKEQKLVCEGELAKERNGDASRTDYNDLRYRMAMAEECYEGEIFETEGNVDLSRDAVVMQELSGHAEKVDPVERNKHERRVKQNIDRNVLIEDEQLEVFDGGRTFDESIASKDRGQHHNIQMLELNQALYSSDANGELKSKLNSSLYESEAGIEDTLVKGKFNSFNKNKDELLDENNHSLTRNMEESTYLPKQVTDSNISSYGTGNSCVMPDKISPLECSHKPEKIMSTEDDGGQKMKGTKYINKKVDASTPSQVSGSKVEDASSVCEHSDNMLYSVKYATGQRTERKDKNMKAYDQKVSENELENERLRKLEEEREREREREKDRMAVDKAALEARERSYAEARERAERATAEVRQRAIAGARERLEKASVEARLRADRAAVQRATVGARQRAAEQSVAQKAASDAHDLVERSNADRFSASFRSADARQSSLSSDLHFQSTGISNGLRYSYSSAHVGAEGESPQRCKARLERYRRTAERAANALAEKNRRDLLAQREREERNRLAEALDAEVKRWSSGKEGNLRALLSTLQYILGPDSGWQPVPLTEVITSVAVKKAYRKATLCVHPDKLQQRGATIQQKYICEKVFDLLKEAWNKFNSEER